jgi:phosphoglycerate dehydrogenase-like enzyme
MTHVLITAGLTPAADHELAHVYGWELTRLRPGTLSDAGDLDPATVGALVVEADRVGAAEFDRFPSLSLVACLRGTPVNIDLGEATSRAVPVLRTPGRNAESVADLVLGLAYSCARGIARAHHLLVTRKLTEDREPEPGRKDVVWSPSKPSEIIPYVAFRGPELSRLTMGLLGFGAVGRRVAAKATALELRVLAHDPYVPDEQIAAAGVEPVPFERLLEGADLLSLHVPSQTGKPLIGERELALMKPTAYLINTARGSALDYAALAAALGAGELAGAGLDVFPDEPLSSSSPLLDLPNVTLTPHIAGASANVVEHHSEILLAGLRALATGNPDAASLANPEVLADLPGVPDALRKAARDQPARVDARGGSGSLSSTPPASAEA